MNISTLLKALTRYACYPFNIEAASISGVGVIQKQYSAILFMRFRFD